MRVVGRMRGAAVEGGLITSSFAIFALVKGHVTQKLVEGSSL